VTAAMGYVTVTLTTFDISSRTPVERQSNPKLNRSCSISYIDM